MMCTKAENQKKTRLAGMWKHSLLQSFAASQQAATAIEYAMIAGGISIVIVVSGSILGGSITTMFDTVQSAMN